MYKKNKRTAMNREPQFQMKSSMSTKFRLTKGWDRTSSKTRSTAVLMRCWPELIPRADRDVRLAKTASERGSPARLFVTLDTVASACAHAWLSLWSGFLSLCHGPGQAQLCAVSQVSLCGWCT